MPTSPRQLIVKTGLDQRPAAQAVYRAAASLHAFRRGHRFARGFSPDLANLPSEEPSSPLHDYLAGHTDGPGIFKWQHYFAIYDRHLHQFRGRPVTLLEIGIAGGGSLGMWRSYLGSESTVWGIDIDPSCTRFADTGINVAIGDQGDKTFWRSFLASNHHIDIVIDDGSHLPEHQITTLEMLLPRLEPAGVYICEDIHGSFQPFHAYLDGLSRTLSDIGFSESEPASGIQTTVASVHRYPLCAVIEKTAATRDSFTTQRYGTEWPEGTTQPSAVPSEKSLQAS